MAPPLWVKSNASFLAGASHPEELVRAAAAMGHTAMALTDRYGVYGIVRAHVAAKKVGLKLIVGAEILVAGYGPLVLLAPHRTAYGELCQLLSGVRLNQKKSAPAAVAVATLGTLLASHAQHIVALCPVPKLLARLAGPFAASACAPRLYAMVVRHCRSQDVAREYALVQAAQNVGVQLLAGAEVLYHTPGRRALLDVLTCIDARSTLASAGLQLRANACHALPSPAQMQQHFVDSPQWLEAAHTLAGRCNFGLEELRYRYPQSRGPKGQSEDVQLAARVRAGARQRYRGRVPAEVHTQLQSELRTIAELRYASYFLSMQDIVLFCRRNKILCQGRGSAANSAVCFCLGITAIDPVQMKLLFSRFLSKARAEPPDIDLDIEHHRREEVIQWLYNREGRRHAAMVANVVRFRWRSCIGEVGRVLGLPGPALAYFGKRMAMGYDAMQGAFSTGGDVRAWLLEAGLSPDDGRVVHLLRLAQTLHGFPRHMSVHPGGFVLGQAPIDTLCAIEPATMPGRTVLQWDKQDIDDIGLFKVDLLGLGALSQVHQTFALVAQHTGNKLSLARVPANDAATYDLLCRADTVGVFQVESRAQMGMLPRLRPRVFYDLVVQVAIVRPGPIQGNMVHPYLRQRALNTPIAYPHPSFAEVLHKTYGVPIFQEQVMKLAILAAGYDPDQADGLRRDMVAWRSHERLEAHHKRITEGMVQKGVPLEFAEQIFAQIRGFGAYGFPESHAASFAHIVYVTAYLRCHHLEAFTCALLNAQPMGFYSPATVVADAHRHGVQMRPIDVQHSAWDCTLEKADAPGKWAVRMGLRYVRNLGVVERAALEQAGPPYAHVHDFVVRTGCNQRACESLLQAGAFDSLASDGYAGTPAQATSSGRGATSAPSDASTPTFSGRRALWWQLRGLWAGRHDALPFAQQPPGAANAALALPVPALSHAEAVHWDMAASHHSTRGHVLEAHRPGLQAAGICTAAQISRLADGTFACHAGLMIIRQRPETARGMTFITLEDETGLVNVVLYPEQSEQYAALLQQAPLFAASGTIQVRHGTVHLLARRLFVPNKSLA